MISRQTVVVRPFLPARHQAGREPERGVTLSAFGKCASSVEHYRRQQPIFTRRIYAPKPALYGKTTRP